MRNIYVKGRFVFESYISNRPMQRHRHTHTHAAGRLLHPDDKVVDKMTDDKPTTAEGDKHTHFKNSRNFYWLAGPPCTRSVWI